MVYYDIMKDECYYVIYGQPLICDAILFILFQSIRVDNIYLV
jgi:hypothetical protein